jgi:kinesin family protein C2/C3
LFSQGAVVKGPCSSFEELYKHNEHGMDQRHVASTAMNAESSRSHLVFSIIVQAKNKATGAATLGKLTLVDLAGSERQSKTQVDPEP